MADDATTLVVAGWLRVAEEDRDAYVAASRHVVDLARHAPGCLAYSLTADSLDPGLVVVHEQWTDEGALLAFRALPDDRPDDGTTVPDLLDAHVRRYHVQEEGPA